MPKARDTSDEVKEVVAYLQAHPNMTFKQVAATLGMKAARVRYLAEREKLVSPQTRRRKLSTKEMEQISRLFGQGISVKRIAQKLSRDHLTVSNYLRTTGHTDLRCPKREAIQEAVRAVTEGAVTRSVAAARFGVTVWQVQGAINRARARARKAEQI